MANGILLTSMVLRQKWIKFADLASVPKDKRLNLSEGWLTRYKTRTRLKEMRCYGEAASVAAETSLMNLITGSIPPDRGLPNKKQSGVKGNKAQLTYLFTTKADGSQKLPLLVIGKAQKPHAFKHKTGLQLGFYYQNNAKAWMTASLYQEWKILLLQDNFAGHIVPDTLTNIHVENSEPNLTTHVQPNDQGIIRCFKAHYHTKAIRHAIDCYEAGVTPAEIYKIDQLEAMRLTQDAWNEVDTTTIRNCWRKANILPDSATSSPTQPILPISSLIHLTDAMGDAITHAEMLVKNALDDLEAIGALQPSNRMDIATLLNPAVETYNMFDATDKDIFKSMMDAKMLQERNAEDDNNDDIDNSEPQAPGLTRRKALQVMLMLKKYIRTINNPFSRKFKVMLGSFGQQTRVAKMQDMKDTKLTDYFSRK
ncbi:DDE-domain-containing protein [Gyrodon lividus]|nr:DDE-domain-containing protein [Gyrodon lividus]